MQAGDIIVRRKKTSNGPHYGRLVRTANVLPFTALHGFYPEFLVSHTTPEGGMRLDTVEEFVAGLPWQAFPQYLSPSQQLEVERIAMEPYNALTDNCEDYLLDRKSTLEGLL